MAGLDDEEKDELAVQKQLGKVCGSLIAFHLILPTNACAPRQNTFSDV